MKKINSKHFIIREATERDNPGIRNVQVHTWKHTYRNMIPDRILDKMTYVLPGEMNRLLQR